VTWTIAKLQISTDTLSGLVAFSDQKSSEIWLASPIRVMWSTLTYRLPNPSLLKQPRLDVVSPLSIAQGRSSPRIRKVSDTLERTFNSRSLYLKGAPSKKLSRD